MYQNKLFSSISITGILGGISKSLNVINQIIPIYQKAKPIFANSKQLLGLLNSINLPAKTTNNDEEKINKKTDKSNNLPVFFS